MKSSFLLPNWNRGLFPREASGRGWKHTILPHPMPNIRMRGNMPPIQNMCLWFTTYLRTNTALPLRVTYMWKEE